MGTPLRAKVASAVGAALIRPAVGRFAATILGNRIPFRGLTVDTSDPLVHDGVKAALLFGAYESAEYRFVHRYLLRDRDALELGGSIGVMTATIRGLLNPGRRHVVVEADPRLATILRRNLELNGRRDVVVEEVAIAYGTDSVRFAIGPTSLGGRIDDSQRAGETIEVPAVTLAGLIEHHAFDDFCLVSDVEGVEWQILREDAAALTRARRIIIETHDRDGYGGYEAFLEELPRAIPFRQIDRYGCVAVFDHIEDVANGKR
ncbi:FkbM family methyltransferase [Sphingomonas asaccharolytica]|uniref:FkbM family methyltransferase n=1 Tax=Sphingomonas asaccharolytica TaxID=40681 RepID=UPI00082BDA3B|nr:FkbM family methyltransferase [Sphingomonas asaccharolytica]